MEDTKIVEMESNVPSKRKPARSANIPLYPPRPRVSHFAFGVAAKRWTL